MSDCRLSVRLELPMTEPRYPQAIAPSGIAPPSIAGSRLPTGADDLPQRGKLKIFFGAFPGAGKTNAMLSAAQRMRESGRDVVAGVVDSHESADRVLLDGFETLPASATGSAGELD